MIFIVVILLIIIIIMNVTQQQESHWTPDVQEYPFVVSHEVQEIEQRLDKEFDKELVQCKLDKFHALEHRDCSYRGHRAGKKGTTLGDKRRGGRYAHPEVDIEQLAEELRRTL